MPGTADLSLADLESHDPRARGGGRERRFLCPLPACAGHTRPGHRSLAVNRETGLWTCHRCGGSGLLREFRPERSAEPPGGGGRERARRDIRRVLALPPPPAPPPAPEVTDSLRAARARPLLPLASAPEARRYLRGRGLVACPPGVLYCPDWPGIGASVVFEIVRPGLAEPVALQARALEGDGKRSAGPVTAGLFLAPGAAEALAPADPGERPPLALVEAPIDALSLAACGLPAAALCGKELGRERAAWLLPLLSLGTVLAAFDADPAGDEAAARIARALTGPACGARAPRLRPTGAKDWNEFLSRLGPAPLRAWLSLELARLRVAPLPAAPPPQPLPLPSPEDAAPSPPDDSAEIVRALWDFDPTIGHAAGEWAAWFAACQEWDVPTGEVRARHRARKARGAG